VAPAPVAVIGTGAMGSAMARRLLDQGHSVHAWNRSRRPLEPLREAGAEVTDDPLEAVAACEVVLTMLPTAAVVSDVMVDRGVLGAMAEGAAWAQMGTIGVDGTLQLDASVRDLRPDVLFVDAPVSGSTIPAERGELVVLASGPEEAAGAVDPVFDIVGRRTVWLGPAGGGSRMKLVLNTWLAFEIEAAAEIAALADAFGIPGRALTDTVAGSPLVSPFAAAKLAKMQAQDDSPQFSLEWALKDLDLVADAVPPGVVPVARAIADRWRGLVAGGAGRLDVSAARLDLGADMSSDGIKGARGDAVS
jgi:3-hydroxyisobutyrate dehydrogenase